MKLPGWMVQVGRERLSDDGKRYRTIVADPPWAYWQLPGRILTSAKSADTKPDLQYPRMTVDEIAALPVREWAEKDAHLYLWVTNPILLDAAPIIEAWGFQYVTALTWHKLGTLGMGYYFRGDTEHVLFGVRGNAPIAPAIRQRNWFAARKIGHSVKPDRFYEIVEAVSPEPRLEMFARRRRVGWDVWGNEAPPESEARTQTHLGLSA